MNIIPILTSWLLLKPAHQVTAAVFGGEFIVTTGARSFDIQICEGDSVPEPPTSGFLFKVTEIKSRGFLPYNLQCL